MDIKSALEPTGKAKKEYWGATYAARDEKGIIRQYCDGMVLGGISSDELNEEYWQPCHEKPEIRPENQDEMWRNSHVDVCYLYDAVNNKLMTARGISLDNQILENKVIHGQNSWTRIYPPVPDENVEKVVIENVAWRRSHGVIFPIADTDEDWQSLATKPRMQMTLKWKKK